MLASHFEHDSSILYSQPSSFTDHSPSLLSDTELLSNTHKKMATPSVTNEPSPSGIQLCIEGFHVKLSNNLYSLWQTSQLCDLTLSVPGGDLRIHSCVLAAFSPTIADIISKIDSHCLEKGEHCRKYARIVVDKFSLEVMKTVVLCIYTGQFVTPPERLGQLLEAARWLKMESLISVVEGAIEKQGGSVPPVSTGVPGKRNEMTGLSTVTNSVFPTTHYSDASSSSKFGHSSSSFKEFGLSKKSPSGTKPTQPSLKASNTSYGTSTHSFPSVYSRENARSVHSSEKLFNNSSTTLASSHSGTGPNNSNYKAQHSSATATKDSSTTPRRGGRMRQMSQKWVESYIANSLIGQGQPEFLDSIVPVIKVEVDDLSTFLSPSEGANVIKYNYDSVQNEYYPSSVVLNNSNTQLNDLKDTDGTGDNFYPHGGNQGRRRFNQTSDFSTTDSSSSTTHQRNLMQTGKSPVKKFSGEKLSSSSVKRKKSKPTKRNVSNLAASVVETSAEMRTSGDLDPHEMSSTEVFSNDDEGVQQLDLLHQTNNTDSDGKKGKFPFPDKLKCIKCKFNFEDVKEYQDHVNNHPIFSCQECPAKFYRKQTLTRHHYSVHLNKSFLHCKECSFKAQTVVELCRHSTQEHNQPRPFCCSHPGCLFRSGKYHAVENHRQMVHDLVEKKFICENCGKRFARRLLLNYHLQSCLHKEEYLCDLCGQAFNRKSGLKMHRQVIHFGIKQYKCEHCFKSFSANSNLKRHLRIHNNTYPYSCTGCGKKFRHSNSLKAHIETHRIKDGINIEVPETMSTTTLSYRNSEIKRHRKQ